MKHAFDNTRRTAVVLDPHPLCQAALSELLRQLDIDVVGMSASVDGALALLEEHRPSLFVTELGVPGGTEAALCSISASRQAEPRLTVVVVSAIDQPDLVEAAFDHGASAYVLKTSDIDAVATAIRQAFEPSLYLAPPRGHGEPIALRTEREVLNKLTRRELEILQLVSGGRSNRQVAEILFVTDQTVKFHLANIYRKLGVRNRFEAARWARDAGILDVAEPAETIAPSTAPAGGQLVSLWHVAPQPPGATDDLEETSP